MVKVLLRLIISMLCLVGIACNNSSSRKRNVNTVMYNDTISIVPTPKGSKELPPNYAYGKILQPIFSDSLKVEQNLISQASSYTSALLHGDVETCTNYMYPEAIQYCRQYYPGFSDVEIFNEIFKEMSDRLKKSLDKMQEMGIDLELVVSRIDRKIEIDDDVIIVFYVSSNMCTDDVFIHSIEYDRTIGISYNRGKNWWFMSSNVDSPSILRRRYDQNVVNDIMGY